MVEQGCHSLTGADLAQRAPLTILPGTQDLLYLARKAGSPFPGSPTLSEPASNFSRLAHYRHPFGKVTSAISKASKPPLFLRAGCDSAI
jgi:hypothetical protein